MAPQDRPEMVMKHSAVVQEGAATGFERLYNETDNLIQIKPLSEEEK